MRPGVQHNSCPLISVVIPTYNASRFLADAVTSVRQQGYNPLEVIVVDDGSTDETRRMAADWPDVTYIYQQNRGASEARNTGIMAATGSLLAFLDSDDLWLPDHLRLLLRPLTLNPDAQFVWGTSRVVQFDSDSGQQEKVLDEAWPGFLIGAGLYRREAFDRVGLYDSDLQICHDTDWYARARHLGVVDIQISDQVLVYRRRAEGLTGNTEVQRVDMLSMVRRSINRQRAA